MEKQSLDNGEALYKQRIPTLVKTACIIFGIYTANKVSKMFLDKVIDNIYSNKNGQMNSRLEIEANIMDISNIYPNWIKIVEN